MPLLLWAQMVVKANSVTLANGCHVGNELRTIRGTQPARVRSASASNVSPMSITRRLLGKGTLPPDESVGVCLETGLYSDRPLHLLDRAGQAADVEVGAHVHRCICEPINLLGPAS